MKKFLFILMLLFTTTLSYSQTYYTDYMSRMIKVDSCWTDWTDWEQCFTEVTINDSTISIYDVQEYTILEIVDTEEDDYSQTIKYKVVYNKDKVIFIRFRKQIGGIKQLYLDYENVIYVYNLNY
jgi:hypothetical protein